jgi:hypothetical protein
MDARVEKQQRAPVFLGFRSKSPWKPDAAWFPAEARHVTGACSVSDCLAEPPPGWLERWDYNCATCYPTEAEARASVPAERRGDFDLFAYWLMPVRREADGQETHVEPGDYFQVSQSPLPPAVGDVPGFEFIGYDVVAPRGPRSHGFDHSPLSCNGMAKDFAVNSACLIDDLETALRASQAFNAEQPEPGEYVVVRVARKSGRAR